MPDCTVKLERVINPDNLFQNNVWRKILAIQVFIQKTIYFSLSKMDA